MRINLKMLVTGFVLMNYLLLSGCHTVKGFGQDVKQGGQAIQNAAS